MGKLREIYDVSVPVEKRKKERANFFVYLIVRPFSILFTWPFIKTKIKPTAITILSIFFLIGGFVLFCIPYSTNLLAIIGWACFFMWAVLDAVDGNLARYTNQCSMPGDLWDATGGYLSNILIYFGIGIYSYLHVNTFEYIPKFLLLIFGGATVICCLFPRLMAHKKESSLLKKGESDVSMNKIMKKSEFGLVQTIGLNLLSTSGFFQVILLLSLIFNVSNFFTCIYLGLNFLMMSYSLYRILIK